MTISVYIAKFNNCSGLELCTYNEIGNRLSQCSESSASNLRMGN